MDQSDDGARTVGELGEFGLVARIGRRLGGQPQVLLGPGDDAAVVAAPDSRVVATTDLLVDGGHFRREWSSGYDIGRKAAAQNLADVAAMGARTTSLLVGLAAPAELGLAWVDALTDGLRDEAALVGAAVVGGDVVASDRLLIAVTALGDLAGASPVTRAGARPGDVVVVAGRLGFAVAGLALLRAGETSGPLPDAHRRPRVDYAGAMALAGELRATAMVDTSDGLVADLGHLARASGVVVELRADALPCPPELVEAAARLDVDPLAWVAAGGDDHAFAATLPAGTVSPYPVLGRVLALEGPGEAGVRFADRTPTGTVPHEHFR